MADYHNSSYSKYVNKTFIRIARDYDLMNRLMTGGMDLAWRKEVIQLAELNPQDRLLDLGTGTGDLARAAMKKIPAINIIAADFTIQMMLHGKHWGEINRCAANALRTPFPSSSFDAIVSGFLMRNVGDVKRALQEQHRLLKPGGRLVILDTTRPRRNILTPLITFHLRVIIPFLGTLITGEREAYTYLPRSTENFLSAEDLVKILEECGFTAISFKIKNLGTIAIHSAVKQAASH